MIADSRSSETYVFNSLTYFETFIHILHLRFEGISAKYLEADSQTHMPRDQIYSHFYFVNTTALHIWDELSLISLT